MKRDNFYPSIKLVRPKSFYLTHIIIAFALVFAISGILWIFFPSLTLMIIFILAILFDGIILLLIFIRWSFLVTRVRKIVENQEKIRLEIAMLPHHALICICSASKFPDINYSLGLEVLVTAFNEERVPFLIYQCCNPDEIREILKNPSAHYLWIFGHGWQGGVTFKERRTVWEIIRMRKKQNNVAYTTILPANSSYPEKFFIGQFHCNHIVSDKSNVALPQILCRNLEDIPYFVSDCLNFPWIIYFSIWYLLRTRNLNTMQIKNK